MGHFADHISNHGRLTLGLAEALLQGVTPDRFARFTAPGGTPIVTNHPAFVIGHLSIYPSRVMTAFLGAEAGDAEVPESWGDIFGAQAECRDDPDGSIYPPMDEVVAKYISGHQEVLHHLPNVDDEVFLRENPNEGFRKRCPTIGMAVGFLMGPHAMMHLGQLSAWRRCEGLGSAM